MTRANCGVVFDARDASRIETRSHPADDQIRFGPVPTCKVPGASLQADTKRCEKANTHLDLLSNSYHIALSWNAAHVRTILLCIKQNRGMHRLVAQGAKATT
jgi:hypothetical protein